MGHSTGSRDKIYEDTDGDEEEDSNGRVNPRSSWKEYIIWWVRVDQWTHEELIVAAFVLALLCFSAGERVFFKAAVDDMAPFRAVLLIFIFFVAFVLFAVIAIAKRFIFRNANVDASNLVDFPNTSLIMMAIVDSISFGGLVLSATGVSPTKTIILMHASTPCVVFGSKFVFSNREYTAMQLTGVTLISLALLISLSDPFIDYMNGTGNEKLVSVHPLASLQPKDVWTWTPTQGIRLSSAVVYTCSAALQGLASLYKEKSIIDYSLPTDIHTMSCWLFFYQFIFALVFFPLFYFLQGISSGWDGFPISSAYENFVDGFHCSIGTDPDSSDTSYETAHTSCSSMKWLIMGYAISTVLVLLFIDKLIVADNQVLTKAMTFAVVTSFVAAIVYDIIFADNIQDSYFGVQDFLAIAVLVIGMETFSRDPEPEPELVTNYSPVMH
eukprot:CAMPEP_0114476802 /NCGR_PEP_ID=MMETSP0104-20121206/14979_1 /TAXON_ID=37642 ORGANISM="Paraphysomonas imperforata, Strain PA2" /NCGR_SAMPLE_ID=MMETSP0104 /ASSEMBLY_ACC=CAM_ASM_000202 /LENGTH=439 /DNA_ID=CAMNT_0001651617 /DNA_START=263 /DNA_END=1582 /DNA_ORIENTATION=+